MYLSGSLVYIRHLPRVFRLHYFCQRHYLNGNFVFVQTICIHGKYKIRFYFYVVCLVLDVWVHCCDRAINYFFVSCVVVLHKGKEKDWQWYCLLGKNDICSASYYSMLFSYCTLHYLSDTAFSCFDMLELLLCYWLYFTGSVRTLFYSLLLHLTLFFIYCFTFHLNFNVTQQQITLLFTSFYVVSVVVVSVTVIFVVLFFSPIPVTVPFGTSRTNWLTYLKCKNHCQQRKAILCLRSSSARRRCIVRYIIYDIARTLFICYRI